MRKLERLEGNEVIAGSIDAEGTGHSAQAREVRTGEGEVGCALLLEELI